MGEIKDFEDHLLKNMIRFVRTLTIFFFSGTGTVRVSKLPGRTRTLNLIHREN